MALFPCSSCPSSSVTSEVLLSVLIREIYLLSLFSSNDSFDSFTSVGNLNTSTALAAREFNSLISILSIAVGARCVLSSRSINPVVSCGNKLLYLLTISISLTSSLLVIPRFLHIAQIVDERALKASSSGSREGATDSSEGVLLGLFDVIFR